MNPTKLKYVNLDVIIGLGRQCSSTTSGTPVRPRWKSVDQHASMLSTFMTWSPTASARVRSWSEKPAQHSDATRMFLDTDGNDLQRVKILDERGEL